MIQKLEYLSSKRLHLFSQDIKQYRERSAGERRVFINYIIASLSDADINIDLLTLKDYVEHSLMLYKNPYWEEIPISIFLSFVLEPRSSKEKIEACRTFFHREIKRFVHSDKLRTILDVNHWSSGEVRYASSDARTKSAWLTYETGTGRCGEQAVFLVQLYRSLGIPSRVVYVPMWSHIDDNHAWVEVYIDNKWKYIGTSENVENLEKAWFTIPSTRAPYVFSHYPGTLQQEGALPEDKHKLWTTIDQTNYYTSTKSISLEAKPELALDTIDIVVINYGNFRILRTIYLKNHKANFIFGSGDFFLRAHSQKGSILKHVPREMTQVKITDSDLLRSKRDISQNPGPTLFRSNLNYDFERKKYENEARDFYNKRYEEKMSQLNLNNVNKDDKEKLKEFLADDFSSLWETMNEKDKLDFKADYYIAHYQGVSKFKDKFPKEIFFNYLANPRILWEEITPYCTAFQNIFKENKEWIENPRLIKKWVDENISTHSNYLIPNVYMPVNKMLDHPVGNPVDKKILVVAIARSLGIPARINPDNYNLEYYFENNFHSFEKKVRYHELTVQGDIAGCTMSLSLASNSQDFSDNVDIETQQNYYVSSYPEGSYELLISKRLPSGKILAKIYRIDLFENQTIMVDDFVVKVEDVVENEDIDKELGAIHVKADNGILIIGDSLEEPSVHAINEVISQSSFINENQIPIYYYEKNSNRKTSSLKKIRNEIKTFQFIEEEITEEKEEAIVRKVFREPGIYPFVCVFNHRKSQISYSGYKVNALSSHWVREVLK